MTTTIEILPTELKQACSIVELYVPYTLNATDCTVFVYYKINGETKKVEQVFIDATEYALWTTSDDYLINLVLSKLGLTRAPSE
jgi:hypothetical protein